MTLYFLALWWSDSATSVINRPLLIGDVPCCRLGRQAVGGVGLSVHGNFLEEEEGDETHARDTNHRLPDDGHAEGKGISDLGTEWLLHRVDKGNSGVGDLRTTGELRDEVGRKLLLQLVLEDGTGNGDTPGLGERAHESEEGQCGGCALYGERSENRENCTSVL